MKNKQVKQMICNIEDSKDEDIKFPFGHFFNERGLSVCFINGCGPDNYYEDEAKVTLGKSSLTANQLRGK